MTKVWARAMTKDKILFDKVLELNEDFCDDNFFELVAKICQSMDVSTPVILQKHKNEMKKFNHSIFLANEFMESVDFDRFIIERFDDEEKKENPFYI